MEFTMVHLKNLLIIPVLIVCLFIIPTIISFSDKNYLNTNINGEVVTTDLLLTFLSSENASLRTKIHQEEDSLLTKSIILMNEITNINMKNLLSYIQNEIPGYHSSKVVGKIDMVFSMESAPPMDQLIKERDLAMNGQEKMDDEMIESKLVSGEFQDKKIFIYHTHSWETYTPINSKNSINITDVGEMLGIVLKEKGITTVVDKTNITQELEKKGWPTNRSYQISRDIVQSVMASNKDFEYFIDLHRDSARKDETTVTLENKTYAKIVFVIGEENKHFKQNLELAKELNNFLDANYPGVSKGILGKYGDGVDGVYNQDLSPNALVVEVGGVDNNEQEIKNTINILADAIGQNYWQAIEVNGTTHP
ncbi:MAG TPA: stage II sporulation protein P [Pseudoneobacillus sp.]|nr:stage II sporulation protein P [Pseudoneobacillus sp.]